MNNRGRPSRRFNIGNIAFPVVNVPFNGMVIGSMMTFRPRWFGGRRASGWQIIRTKGRTKRQISSKRIKRVKDTRMQRANTFAMRFEGNSKVERWWGSRISRSFACHDWENRSRSRSSKVFDVIEFAVI